MVWWKHLLAWANHGALNLGSAVSCFWHALVPPQYDHRQDTCVSLSKSNPLHEFLLGMRGYGLNDEGRRLYKQAENLTLKIRVPRALLELEGNPFQKEEDDLMYRMMGYVRGAAQEGDWHKLDRFLKWMSRRSVGFWFQVGVLRASSPFKNNLVWWPKMYAKMKPSEDEGWEGWDAGLDA